MNRDYPFSELQEKLNSARNLLIALPQKANLDQVAAALSLFLSLKKTRKNISLFAPDLMTVEFSHLVGVDQISNKMVGGDLVMTLDYPVANIDKVSYNDEGGKLNLVINLKPGSSPLNQNQVIFNSGGAVHDLIFLVGVAQIEDLGDLFKTERDSLTQRPVVIIGNTPSQLGNLSFIDNQACSCCEIAAKMIKALTLPIDQDIGSNLLLGLREATENFQNPRVNPNTFEAAAFALRMGARSEAELPQPLAKLEKPGGKAPAPDWFEPKIYRGTSLS